jgi:hypothetical protein
VNGAVRDVAHRIYQSDLYFFSIIRCHGTRTDVPLFTPISKVRTSCSDFQEHSVLHLDLLYRIAPKSTRNAERADRI